MSLEGYKDHVEYVCPNCRLILYRPPNEAEKRAPELEARVKELESLLASAYGRVAIRPELPSGRAEGGEA